MCCDGYRQTSGVKLSFNMILEEISSLTNDGFKKLITEKAREKLGYRE